MDEANKNLLSSVVLAFNSVIKDGANPYTAEQVEEVGKVNKRFYEDMVCAIKIIQDEIIPGLKQQLAMVSAQESNNDLTIQILAHIEFYRKLTAVLQKNGDIAYKAESESVIK
ncbi:hypothetical protein GAMM_350027 [Gammaproteobacteria bacterium]